MVRLPEERIEECVETPLERLRAAHQSNEFLDIVRHAPEGRLRRTFAVVVAVRGIGPRAVRPARKEVPACRIPNIRPVARARAKGYSARSVSHRIRKNRRRRVIERKVLCARYALRCAVTRHPASRHVRRQSAARFGRTTEKSAILPAKPVVGRLRHGGVLLHGRVGGVQVKATKSLRPCLGEHHLRRRAYHDARVRGIRPFRQPAALTVHLHEGLHHTVYALGRHEGEQRVFGPVCVPQ